MKTVLFRAGYYEWNVFMDDDCIYSFGDIGGEDITEDMTYAELEDFVDDCICYIQKELEDTNREQLEEKYIPELKRQMVEAWSYHFGIEKIEQYEYVYNLLERHGNVFVSEKTFNKLDEKRLGNYKLEPVKRVNPNGSDGFIIWKTHS